MSENEARVSRAVGQLEFYNSEPLPPTPITPEAVKTLESWGLSAEMVAQLQEFCSSFRYDLVPEKIKRIAKHTLVVDWQHDLAGLQVTVPYATDIMGRLDGQCGDLSRQFLIQAEFSGLLDTLNAHATLPPGHLIVTTVSGGKSKTHFCLELSRHFWNGLALVNQQGEVVSDILIDVSFQVISTYQQSGYIQKTRALGIQAIDDISLHREVKAGVIDLSKGSNNLVVNDGFVLGVTSDREYALALGFLQNVRKRSSFKKIFKGRLRNEREIIPCITAVDAEGENRTFVLHLDDKRIMDTQPSQPLPDATRREIEEILRICENFKFTNDRQALPPMLGSHHISWSAKGNFLSTSYVRD